MIKVTYLRKNMKPAYQDLEILPQVGHYVSLPDVSVDDMIPDKTYTMELYRISAIEWVEKRPHLWLIPMEYPRRMLHDPNFMDV